MKNILLIFLLIVTVQGCQNSKPKDSPPGNEIEKPLLGILQFRVQHNLANDNCISSNNCNIEFEADGESIQGWLDDIRNNSNMAVLHWDRSIPWFVFAENPSQEETRIQFYDQKLDSALLKWIDAFKDHFAEMDHGFLAVSLLHGDRNRPQGLFMGPGNDIEIAQACSDISPGTLIQVEYNDGTGLQKKTFDLEAAYLNFILYLYEKLKPDFLAIMVEANLFKQFCPDEWPGLSALYHSLYDTVRARIANDVKVFATMVYMGLLNYDVDECHGQVKFEACPGSGDPPIYDEPDSAVCYPMDMSAIDDFNQGDRLEILALSFYPDALLMSISGFDDNIIYLYPEIWDGTGDCEYRAMAPPFIDPFEQLGRLEWKKPIAIAETSARSCRTTVWYEDEQSTTIINPPADTYTQAFWIELILSKAIEEKFEFYIQSFLRDYDVLGPWVVRENVMPYYLHNLVNTWPCSGIYDKDGNPKGNVTDIWLDYLNH